MWFVKYVIDFLDRIETFWYKNTAEAGNSLVENGHLDHLCWDSKMLCFGLGSVVLRGWLVYFLNVIFSNAINIVWCGTIPEVLHESVEIDHLGHICWVSKTWLFIVGRLGFRCWLGKLRKSIIFIIIIQGVNLILVQNMLYKRDELVKFIVKFIHFLMNIFLFGINNISHEEEPPCCNNWIVLTIVAEETKYVEHLHERFITWRN